jgi:hypothetical protein
MHLLYEGWICKMFLGAGVGCELAEDIWIAEHLSKAKLFLMTGSW